MALALDTLAYVKVSFSLGNVAFSNGQAGFSVGWADFNSDKMALALDSLA